MGISTSIEWCDSTLNLMMGCDGCELWNEKAGIRRCYAGTMTERYAGQKGWPVSFNQPQTFEHRLEQALRWPNLCGRKRPDKPWLNGLPRVIFLDDMGDTFTESLPVDWLMPSVERMENAACIWMFLTKRPKRARLFFEKLGRVPTNFWIGTSVPNVAAYGRVDDLLEINATLLFLSLEPLWGKVAGFPVSYVETDPSDGDTVVVHNQIRLAIFGGESGEGALLCDAQWIRDGIQYCRAAGIAPFVKQLGSNAYDGGHRLNLRHPKGGDQSEWPSDLRIRQFPEIA